MSALNLIANALSPETPPETPEEGLCCVTGDIGPTINRKHVIKPSFTAYDRLKAPDSPRASIAAWRALGYKWQRMSSWRVTPDGFERIQAKQTIRDYVFSDTDCPAPWAGYVTTSYKKHGGLIAPVNNQSNRVWLFELQRVNVSDLCKVRDWWARLRAAQTDGIPRPVIESLDAGPALMAKLGLAVWIPFEQWANPRKNDPLYRFLSYLLPSQEELKNGYTDS